MKPILPELQCAAIGPCRVVRGRGKEAMNALPTWTVEVLLADATLDVNAALCAPATLLLGDEAGTVRAIGLLVTSIAYEGGERDGHRFAVELAPPEWLLTLRAGYRVFLEKTTQQVVAEVMRDAGLSPRGSLWRLAGTYMRRLQCTQYAETEWAFVERLLAEEGISYWFDGSDDLGPTLVFGDAPGAHDGIAGNTRVPYDETSGLAGAADALFELAFVHEVSADAVHLREYDIRQPDVFIEGRAGYGPLEVFEFPACVLTSAAAEHRAKARIEQLQRLSAHATAESGIVRLQPGRLLRVDGCADEVMNEEYLIVSVEHELTAGSPHDANGVSYRNRVTLVPAGARAFRPPVPDCRHRFDGVETAVTTGPLGEEIHVDDLGRVKLRFPWDRSGIADDRSSAWVRCLQMNLGGAMVLPRVGWEVPVVYVDGNPDRPFVLGRAYNATAIVPYALPAAAATTSFQSATSPGGGSTNEIRMSDVAGQQETFLHASKDQTVAVGGSSRTTVSGNETHDVGLAHELTVLGSQTLNVGGSQSVNVGTSYAIGVDGARSESVGGTESVRVTANRAVVSGGGYTELVGGFYGLQCNQSNTTVLGAFAQTVGGAMVLAAGLGTSESVASIRTEIVGGTRNIVAAGQVAESVRGSKTLVAGAVSETAAGAITTKALAPGSVKVGGSVKLSAGGDFVDGGTDDHPPGRGELDGRSPEARRRGAQGDERDHRGQGNDQAFGGSEGRVMEGTTPFRLAIDGFGLPWLVLRLAGRERIHAPFSFEVTCANPARDDVPVDPEALVTQTVRLTWPTGDGGERIIVGFVDRAEALDDGYRVVVVPHLAELADVVDHRVFLHKDAATITEEVLGARGLQVERRLTRALQARPQCVQFFEQRARFRVAPPCGGGCRLVAQAGRRRDRRPLRPRVRLRRDRRCVDPPRRRGRGLGWGRGSRAGARALRRGEQQGRDA